MQDALRGDGALQDAASAETVIDVWNKILGIENAVGRTSKGDGPDHIHCFVVASSHSHTPHGDDEAPCVLLCLKMAEPRTTNRSKPTTEIDGFDNPYEASHEPKAPKRQEL